MAHRIHHNLIRFGLIVSLIVLILTGLCGGASAGEIFYPTGTYTAASTDLTVAARSIPMAWERSNRSNRVLKRPGVVFFDILSPADGPLGYGWHSPWTVRLSTVLFKDEEENLRTQATFIGADGRAFTFEADSAGTFPPDLANGYELVSVAGGYELRQRGGNTLLFDGTGRLTSVRDPRGQSANLNYDGAGQLSTILDVAGRTVFTFAWSGGHITRVTDLAGRTIDYAYDGAGNLERATLAGKPLVSYGYNAQHGLTIETNPLGESWRVGYGQPDKGIVSSITNPAGKTLALKADFDSRIFRLTDYGGVTRRFILDASGNVVADAEIKGGQAIPRVTIQYQPDGSKKSIDAQGQATFEERDAWGNVNKRVDAEGNVTIFTYNAHGKPLTITDAEGVTTAFSFDASGTLPVTITRAQGRPEQVVTTFTYTPSGDLETTATDGAVTRFSYNAAGLPLTVTDPLGNVSSFEYDPVGNLTAATDASGNRSLFTYDERRNLLTAKDPLGNTTTYAYNLAGRLAFVTNPLDHVTATVTDFAGRITRLTPPAGAAKVFAYDGAGNLTRVTFGDAVTDLRYDSRGRLTTVTDPEGNITTYQYDDGGCSTCGSSSDVPKKITDPFGAVTENLFDKNGRVTGVQDPLGHLTSLDLDKVGRVERRIDGNGKATAYQYDALGRVTAQTDANGGSTSFTYDKRGNLTTLTDPEGNTTTFEYDLAGRKKREIRPLGQATEYTYYPNGLLKTVKDAKGQTTTYTYDDAGRLTEVLYADGQKDTFGYDAAGNLTAYANAQVSGTLAYDPAGRKLQETVTTGTITKSFSYSYDPQGNKATYTSPEGVLHSYSFDKAGKLTQIAFGGQTVSLAYEKTRLKSITYPNGVTTDYAYNAAHWLTGITTAGANGARLTRSYGFDSVGNITSNQSEHGPTAYGYDNLYQLTSADHPESIGLPDEAFTYDQVGNRLTSAETQGTWSYNRNNELQSSVTTTFTYDANGNTTQKTEGDQTTVYTYDARNRLTQVTLPDGTTASYAYDPFGRRVKKTVGATASFYTYADEGLIGEYDASGTLQSAYGWKPDGLWGTDPLYLRQNGTLAFYHNDHLGTPQKMTDGLGAVVWSAEYAAFGEATVDQASTITNNLRFPGQYFDAETRLNYNLNRFFGFKEGVYLQEDPLGYFGSFNLYTYSFNSPIMISDPLGLRGSGHHMIPYSLFDNKVSKEVFNVFDGDSARIFNEAFKSHNGSPINGIKHGTYNELVKSELDKFIKAEKTCLEKMTKQQALKFLEIIKNKPANSAIQIFNSGVRQQAAEALAKLAAKRAAQTIIIRRSGEVIKRVIVVGVAAVSIPIDVILYVLEPSTAYAPESEQ